MNGFRRLVWKEWRDHRAVTLVFAGMAALGFGLLPLAPANWMTASAVAEVMVPCGLTLFLAVIAADAVSGDAATGRLEGLALLPVRPIVLWCAKATHVLVAGVLFLGWLLLCGAAVLAVAGTSGAVGWFLRALPHGTVLLVAAFLLATATLFFSTLNVRGVAALLAAGIVVGGGGFAVSASLREVQVAAAESDVMSVGFAASVVFLVASALAFARGRVCAGERLRPAVIGLGIVTVVFGGAGTAGAMALADYLDLSPGEAEVRIEDLHVAPDGRHVAMEVYNVDRYGREREVWVVDVATGEVSESQIPDARFSRLGAADTSWDLDGTLILSSTEQVPGTEKLQQILRWFDPDEGRVVRTRDRISWEIERPGAKPWGTSRFANGTQPAKVTWTARKQTVTLPEGRFVVLLHEPGEFAYSTSDGDWRLRRMETGEDRLLVEAPAAWISTAPAPSTLALVSWSNRYAGQDARYDVIDTADGSVIAEMPYAGSVHWLRGSSDTQVLVTHSGGADAEVVDVRDGERTPLRIAPWVRGVTRLQDGRYVAWTGDSIHLLHADGTLERQLYPLERDAAHRP